MRLLHETPEGLEPPLEILTIDETSKAIFVYHHLTTGFVDEPVENREGMRSLECDGSTFEGDEHSILFGQMFVDLGREIGNERGEDANGPLHAQEMRCE